MFNLADYMTAEERIQIQAEDNEDFRYDSTHEFIEDKKTGELFVAVKAYIWRTHVDVHPWVSGLAAENMKTPFAIEKAETSAYARAITNTGLVKYSTAKSGSIAPRANREEMEKVANIQAPKHVISMVGKIDAWSTPTRKEPVALGDGIEIVSDSILNPVTPTAPLCAHGVMKIKQGNSPKTGKDYLGYICDRLDRTEQCSPIWYRKSADGQWVKPWS